MVKISDKNNGLKPAAWLYKWDRKHGTKTAFSVTQLKENIPEHGQEPVPLVRADHLPLEDLIDFLAMAHRHMGRLNDGKLDERMEENRELQDGLERLLWEVSQDG